MPEGVLIRELEGESVILNLESESYFGLDGIGTRMLALLTDSDSIGAAYEKLLDEYEVDPDVLKADLCTFIDKLAESGLINVSES